MGHCKWLTIATSGFIGQIGESEAVRARQEFALFLQPILVVDALAHDVTQAIFPEVDDQRRTTPEYEVRLFPGASPVGLLLLHRVEVATTALRHLDHELTHILPVRPRPACRPHAMDLHLRSLTPVD